MTTIPRRTSRRLAAAATLALLTVGAVGCSGGEESAGVSGGSSGGEAGTDTGGGSASVEAPVPEEETEAFGQKNANTLSDRRAGLDASASRAQEDSAVDAGATDRKLISNGNVALRSDDVAKTQFDVVKVADTYGGEVESKESQTDDEGAVIRSRMVLRIPTADFITAMDDLSATAQLLNNSSTTEDVTTEVLDKDIRIRLQRRSIERIELLLDRAENIRDIVNIEGQLSRRQADLASLERKQRYLADQTEMSTVVVSVEKTPEEDETKDERDTAGFFVGLGDGWDALRGVGTDVSTAAGAVLPFALLGGVIGLPLWTIVRRRRRSTAPAPAAG